MKRLLFIIMLLMSTICSASTMCYYVDTDASGDNDGGRDGTDPNDPSDESNWTNAWTHLSTAENALDGVASASHTYRIYVRASSGAVDTTSVDVANWTNDPNIEIVGYDFTGSWNANSYTLNAHLDFYENNVTVTGVQFLNDATGTANETTSNIISTTSPSTIVFDKCIFKCTADTTGNTIGIKISDGSTDLYIRNCLFYGFKTSTSSAAINGGFTADVFVYNCTIFDNYYGIYNDSAVVVRNTISANNTDDFSGITDIQYSASDDTQAGTGNIDWDNGATDWAANFTNYSAGDFTVKDTNADIYYQGTNLVLSTDIASYPWNNPPSIGAYEYSGGSPPPTPTSTVLRKRGITFF